MLRTRLLGMLLLAGVGLPTLRVAPAAAHGGNFLPPPKPAPDPKPPPPPPPPPPPENQPTTPPEGGNGPGSPVTPPGNEPPKPEGGNSPTTPGAPPAPVPAPPATPAPGTPPTGPTPGAEPGGADGGGRGRRTGATGGAEDSWETWWILNRWAFLPDRDQARARLEETDPTAPGVGRAAQGAEDGRLRQRELAAMGRVLPFLREVIDPESHARSDVVASALLALGKVSTDRTAIPILVRTLQDDRAPQIVRESAALAAGLLRRSRESQRLSGAELDRLRERLLDAFDDRNAPDRVRAFAALSLGLLGDQPFGTPFTENGVVVVQGLWSRLGGGYTSVELPIALLVALGMQPSAGVPEGLREAMRGLVQGKRTLGRTFGPYERSHALTALARWGGPGIDVFLLRVLGRRGEDAAVRKATWIALGARADRMAPEDRGEALTLALKAIPREHEPLAVGLSHVTLGRILGAELRATTPRAGAITEGGQLLLLEARGGSAATRGFSAIALALACRGVHPPNREVLAFVGEAQKGLARWLAMPGDPVVRGAFAVALGLLETPNGVGPLLDVVQSRDADDSLRGHAAVSLGALGRRSPEVLRALNLALAERRSEVLRRQAALGLSLLGSPLASTQLLREMESGISEHLLAQVAVAFGRLDDLAAVDPLLRLARDQSRSELTQALAVVSLGLIVDPEHRPSLYRLSTDADYPARTDALHEALSIL